MSDSPLIVITDQVGSNYNEKFLSAINEANEYSTSHSGQGAIIAFPVGIYDFDYPINFKNHSFKACLLYTSDAADE